nr:hypothetical protein [Tanacetum cinerariifolium]
MKSVTASKDNLNSRTLNANFVCATCNKCLINSNHFACVTKMLNDVNVRTKKPTVVPISTRKPKRQANKSVATHHKKKVASKSTNQKLQSYFRMLYEKTSKAWKWCIEQQSPSGYKWVPKTKMQWAPKAKNDHVQKRVSFAVDNASRITNVLKRTNSLGSNLSTIPSSSNSLADFCANSWLWRFGSRKCHDKQGLLHQRPQSQSLSVGQFCDADLEVGFRKSTCFVRDLQGNDLLTGNRGSDLYTISLQESTSSTPLCLMAKASPTLAWLWHRRLSHLNFDYINLLSKKDIVIGLPKLKYVKDQLCSSCELSKAKRSSFKSKVVSSSKRKLNLLHMDLCGPMRDETPKALKEFLTMIQINLQALVITVRTDRGTDFLNKTLNAFFKEEGIEHQTYTARTPEQNGVIERRNRLVSQRQKVSDYGNPGPIPQRQDVSSSTNAHVPSQQELDLLFGPLYDNAGSNPQDKQSSMNIQPTSEPSTPTYVHAEENNDYQVEGEHLP